MVIAYQIEQWVSIEGKVSTRDFHGRKQPYVEITKIKSAEPILGLCIPLKNYKKKRGLTPRF